MSGINRIIDHTLLMATATSAQVIQLCNEAKEYQFASVCIPPNYVSLASSQLAESDVKVCTVIGFPLGYNNTSVKIFEAKKAIAEGAEELDYVLNIAQLKNGNFEAIEVEMQEFAELKKDHPDLIIKVILETCYLTKEEIVQVCRLAKQAGIDFVKTSTGFGTGGATIEDVQLMRQTVGTKIGVKASGGVRTIKDAEVMIKAGANRIGTSNGVGIVSGNRSVESNY
ncbi:deoxyribose-phosphate aldolase [Neobacillus sp. LXY-4]|uniref:deoxyribose-phosphate aldolase n=1 Tax=Neobacillus sp. LXY-4 TaxID=3379826 RepID=UPI003EE3A656